MHNEGPALNDFDSVRWTAKVSVLLAPEEHDAIRQMARRQHRSVSSVIRESVASYLSSVAASSSELVNR